jgi:hydrogenase expression/formation protein HypD
MEVCGTHTRAITKCGIRHLLPQQVELLSGPGCPVCVTHGSYIDKALEIANSEDVILAAFGDMIKVNGTKGSLSDMQIQGARIIVVYSPEDVLTIAAKNRDKLVVFAAVGFETTAPLIAAVVKTANAQRLDNLLFYTALKIMEPVIRFILQDKRNKINGLICPGHVAVIKGADYFRFITAEFGVPAIVCGFEAADIAAGICMLMVQIAGKRPVEFANIYRRCVSPQGNTAAQSMINEVLDIADGAWRGIGVIRNSALILNKKYEHLDAAKRFGTGMEQGTSPAGCLCSDILMGLKSPYQCKLFGTTCTPEHSSGPCMVSSEGACAVYYRYGGGGAGGQ